MKSAIDVLSEQRPPILLTEYQDLQKQVRELREIFTIATITMADCLPVKANAVYLFRSNVPGVESSILQRGYGLYTTGRVPSIYIYGRGVEKLGEHVLYSGAPAWRKYFESIGVFSGDVHEIPSEEDASHTGKEAMGLARTAKEKGWSRIIVVAAPFHMTRAFVNAVTAASRAGAHLRIYACPGIAMPWNRTIFSQDQRHFLRDVPDQELARLCWTTGNEYGLLSPAEILDYVKWRDNQ